MKKLLICPSPRPKVAVLSETVPLAAIPIMGQALIQYWLSFLARAGESEILVLANDRPECIKALVGDGARWGMKVEVSEESRELTPAEASLKYQKELGAVASHQDITVLDHFPEQAEGTLFDSYASWFSGLQTWLPKAKTVDRVGVREADPGIWIGLNAQISPRAKIQGPCWVGSYTRIGAGASIGPGAIIEDRCVIEPSASIARSYIGPDTFVGRFAAILNSLAWGSNLVNWTNDSETIVPDRFILCALRRPSMPPTPSWLARLTEVCARGKIDVQLVWKQILMNKEL